MLLDETGIPTPVAIVVIAKAWEFSEVEILAISD